MRVLFVSGELIAGDIARRLCEEGCEVKLFVDHPEQQECLGGFVEKTNDWKKELSWVGKDGLIIFDDVGYGEEQDRLRKEDYRVVGGCAVGDRLEKERGYGDAILRQCGMETVPIFDFSDPGEAIDFIKKNPKCFVVKQNNHQSALNYVGVLDDGRDVLNVLELYKKVGIKNVTLQEKIEGVEIGIARYFNGYDWVGPIEMNVEHKSLFNGNIGPKTGEMGTLMWYDSDEENKLFQNTLAKFKAYLSSIDFRGDVDVSVFVDGDKIFPIEITARFGCPSTYLQGTMHYSPWYKFLGAIADGKQYDLKYYTGYGIVLTLALPPFPYSGNIDKEYSSEGLEVLYKDELLEEEKKRIHFEGVYKKGERCFVSESLGYVLFVSGRGESIKEAQKSALDLAEKVVIPKIFYRTDIGEKFLNKDMKLLREWGWI